MVEVKPDKCVQTSSLIEYNEEKFKNQSIKNLETLMKSSGKTSNNILNLFKNLIVYLIKKN